MKSSEKRKARLLKEALLLELRNVTGSPVPSASKYYARIVNNGYVLYYNVGENKEPSPIENKASAFFSNISEVPDAGLDWVEDDEYKAMLKEVMSKLPELLAKGISKNGTFAYSGKIPPKFIKRWKEYPKKAYPKSIETGSGSADSYEKQEKVC